MDTGQTEAGVEVTPNAEMQGYMLAIGKAFTLMLTAAEKQIGRKLVLEAYVVVHDAEHVGLGIEFQDKLAVVPAEGRA